jgi:DNA-binding SARP family transcriptional activator
MDFRILGPLEVWDGERQLDLGGSKRRAVLAFLVLHANEVVSSDRLVDRLWGEKVPRNAPAALQTHVSRLRKELGPELVATRAWGYVLRTEPATIDLERFERLVAEAENLPARERAGKLRAALALWRGTPLEDLAFEPALAKEIARLEELRLAVLENRIDADLEAGNPTEIIGELETVIADNPLRERLRGQLILALYRSGRQAEALEVYRETRRVLADELGLDPSPELRELERAILRQDPSLAPEAVSVELSADRQPPPGRRRRLYLGAIAVVLLGATAAVAAVLETRGAPVAKQSAPRTVTRTTTAAHASVPATGRAGRPVHAQIAARRGVSPRVAKTAAPARTTNHTRTTKPASVRQRGTRLATPPAHPPSALVSKPKPKPATQAEPTKPVRIAYDFSDPSIDPLIWGTWSQGTGASAAQQNGQLVFAIAADATFESQFHSVGINVGTKCKFSGNFDARVDYTLLRWPAGNGASVSLLAYQTGPVEEISRTTTSQWGDIYTTWPGRGAVALADTSGSLRIARSNGVVRTYLWHHDQWKALGRQAISGDIWIGMTLSAFANDWQQMNVSAAFDKFVLTAPDAVCPAGSDPRNP